MRSVIIAGLLSTAYATQAVDKRQNDDEDFDSAADALIEAYIPDDQWQVLTESVAAAASEAQVTGEPSAIIYSILKETEAPDWWSDAIPDGYTSEMVALESAIDELRGDSNGGEETVIEVVTTDSDGEDITTSITTTVPSMEETVIAVTTTDEDGNEVTTEITTSMRPPVTETTVVETETTDEAGNTVTTSVTTTRTTTFTEADDPEETGDGEDDENAAAMPEAMAKAAAGVAAILGVAIAL